MSAPYSLRCTSASPIHDLDLIYLHSPWSTVHTRGPDSLPRDAQLLRHPVEAHSHQRQHPWSPAQPRLRRPAGHAGDGAVQVWTQPGHPASAKVPNQGQGRQRGQQPNVVYHALKSTKISDQGHPTLPKAIFVAHHFASTSRQPPPPTSPPCRRYPSHCRLHLHLLRTATTSSHDRRHLHLPLAAATSSRPVPARQRL
jgi:hypothetical protein